MCSFLPADSTHETATYPRTEGAHYDSAGTYDPSPSPRTERSLIFQQSDPHQYNPPQDDLSRSSSPASITSCAGLKTSTTDLQFPESASPGIENTKKRSDAHATLTRPATVRVQHSSATHVSADSRKQSSFSMLQSPEHSTDALKTIVELREFLVSAPAQFGPGEFIRQFRLPSEEQVSCVRWKQVFCITGTDILRSLVFRLSVFGREVINRKKFEEGVFSDLRNLKINVDATLESPKSELLELLYKHHCVRTKKKQKVFFWYSVQHDQLFLDTLERELKREQAHKIDQRTRSLGVVGRPDDMTLLSGSPASTRAVSEPALSFKFNSAIPLIEQVSSVAKRMPPDFATLIDATTMGLNDPSEHNSAVFGDLSSAFSVQHKNGGRSDIIHNDKSTLGYPPCPMTPVNSLSGGHNAEIMLSAHNGQQSVFATPDSLGSMPTTTSLGGPISATDGPTWTPPSMYDTQIAISASPNDNPMARLQHGTSDHDREETDFPLDLLIQHDYAQQKPLEDTSFHNKYHDFVYNNRPALSTAPMLAASLFCSTSPGVPVTELDVGQRRGYADGTQLFSSSPLAPFAQRFPPMWSRSSSSRGPDLRPALEHGSQKGNLDWKGSGRIIKYGGAHVGGSKLYGSTFADHY